MPLFCHFLLKFLRSPIIFSKLIIAILLILFSEGTLAAEIGINLNRYQIELATDAEQRRRGLMHREHMAFDQGMLLVYPVTGDHRIWMKNMLIPLTVVWIGENLKIIEVQKLLPCKLNPCTIYSSANVSRYVLELNAEQHDIRVGDPVEGIEKLLE